MIEPIRAEAEQDKSGMGIQPSGHTISRPDSAELVFDAYMMIDWSSRRAPTYGVDSIWIGTGVWEDQLLLDDLNCGTRTQALAIVRETLQDWNESGRRVLIGFDFSFGYPAGFNDALLGAHEARWLSTMNHFSQHVEDDIGGSPNVHNRDAFAAQCNVAIGGGPGPFWGCHNAAASPDLTTNRIGVFAFPYHGLREFRTTEVAVGNRAVSQSVWKLNQGVSVGGQTILGIKYLHALRFQSGPELESGMYLWPFETGWAVPENARTVVVEIFPSIIEVTDHGGPRDRNQVLSCVEFAARKDETGELLPYFESPQGVAPAQLEAVESEEGWILFV